MTGNVEKHFVTEASQTTKGISGLLVSCASARGASSSCSKRPIDPDARIRIVPNRSAVNKQTNGRTAAVHHIRRFDPGDRLTNTDERCEVTRISPRRSVCRYRIPLLRIRMTFSRHVSRFSPIRGLSVGLEQRRRASCAGQSLIYHPSTTQSGQEGTFAAQNRVRFRRRVENAECLSRSLVLALAKPPSPSHRTRERRILANSARTWSESFDRFDGRAGITRAIATRGLFERDGRS